MTRQGWEATIRSIGPRLGEALDAGGAALCGTLPSAGASDLIAPFGRNEGFRRTVVMQGHGYGAGRYSYFDYPCSH